MSDYTEMYNSWIREEEASFTGWDFSHLTGRMTEEPLPWDYRNILNRYLKPEHILLDMGTGGGEFLLSLNHTHKNTYVTEAYAPNLELCFERLTPLGITVKQILEDDIIPYDDNMYDMVINRHESFNASEIFRVLKPEGIFITQQVGGENNRILSDILIEDFHPLYENHNLTANISLVENAGFRVMEAEEYFPKLRFTDVGAVVYFAKVIEWEFMGFSVERCKDRLLQLQSLIEKQGYIESREHRFILVCRKEA